MANDPYWNSVVLAMHMDDTGLTDLKGHAVTLTGNVARSSTQSKFGGYSAAFDGSGDLASVASSSDFAFGTGDFTIEFFVRQAVAGTALLIDCRPNSSSNGAYITMNVDASGIYLYVSSAVRITGPVVSAGAWHHIALSRSSGSTRLFVDGTQAGATYADATSYISCPVNIGASGNLASVLNGHIDDMRITKGVARYTANFAVPTEAFPNRLPQLHGTVKDQYGNFAARPIIAFSRNRAGTVFSTTSDATTGEFTLPVNEASEHVAIALPVEGDQHWSNVVLAMHMDDTGLTDLKGNTITAVGNAARSSTQSKFGGYSLYLDGAGDYLTAQYNPAKFDWWTEDFTLEAWVYADAFTTWQYSDGTYLHAKLIGNTTVAAVTSYWSFGPLASGVVQFRYWNGSATSAVVSMQTVTAGAWNHIALVKTSAGINIFVNGVGLKMPVPINGTPRSEAGAPLAVGAMNSAYLAGYIDDLRITKGVARYIANFTPPSAAFPHAVTGGTENALIFDNLIPV